MTALAENVGANQSLVSVDDPTSLRLDEVLRIDDEFVIVRSRPRAGGKVLLGRGALGSEKATHSSGTSMLLVVVGSGSGVSATDGTTTVDPATSIRVPQLTDAGGGEAVINGVVVSDTDPGAIGAGYLWLQSGPSVTPYVIVWLRNEADDSWLLVTPGAITQDVGGNVDMWDSGFQSNLFLSSTAAGGTKLVNSTSGIVIVGSVGGFTHFGTRGHIAAATTSPGVVTTSDDPTAGGGFAAPLASFALRQNGSTGELWLKTGTADTAWTKVI